MTILFFIYRLDGGGAERVASIILNHLCPNNDTYVALDDIKFSECYTLDKRVNIIDNSQKLHFKGATRIPRFIKMFQTIKKINPDIIISFITRTNNNALFANLFFHKKIIVSERNSLKRELPKTQRLFRKLLYPIADKIVFVTAEDRINFQLPQKSLTIYNPAMFSLYENYNNRQKSVVTIAPINRWYNKGLDILIKAWAKISGQNTDWKLEILARKDDNKIPDEIGDIDNQKNINWLGWKTDIADVLRKKSIFILASRVEGCPNSLIEAMSQGCACIGTDCAGGIKEIITDGVDGLIAKCEDVENIAAKLQMLIDNENLRHKLSAGAIKKAKQFDKKIFFTKWDSLIEETVGCKIS